MLRINQLAKELGVSNHDVLDALEKHLGVQGKSHSSNLSDDQINGLRRVMENKPRSEEAAPAAPQPPPTAPKAVPPTIRIVKPTLAPPPPPMSAPPAVLIKKPEAPAAVSTPVEAEPVPASAEPNEATAMDPSPTSGEALQAMLGRPASQGEGFSRLRISQAPSPAAKPSEPARYIQLPQAVPAKGRPEAGARPVIQRPGQPSQVSRSGQPQPEKTLLPMAANTGKGAVKHDPAPVPASRRPFIPPSITELRSDSGFTRIKMSDTPAPAPRPSRTSFPP